MGLFDDLIPSVQAAPAPAPVVPSPPPQANGLFDDLIPNGSENVDPIAVDTQEEPSWGQKLQGGIYDLMGGYNAAQLAAAQDDLAEAEAQAPDMGTMQRVLQTGTYLSRDERIAAAKARRAEALKNLTYYNRRSASVPQGPAMENFNKQEGLLDTLGAFAEHPVDVGSSLVLRSLPASAPSIAGGVGGFAVGGPVGAALGAGLGSAITEYGSGITQQLQEFGADMNDEASILATWEAHQDEILKNAGLRAAIVGGTDAATGGLTGRIARKALSPLKKTAAGTGVQMVGGGGGEAAAEVFADKKPISWPNVMGEVLAEGVHGGLEAAGEVGIDAAQAPRQPGTTETLPTPSYGLFDDLVPAPAAPVAPSTENVNIAPQQKTGAVYDNPELLAEDALSVLRSEVPGLSEVRRPWDSSVSRVDGFQNLPAGYGAEAEGPLNRQDQQRSGLLPGQLPLGDTAGAITQPPGLREGLAGQDSYRASREAGQPPSDNNLQSSQGRDVGREGFDYREAAHGPSATPPLAQRNDTTSQGVGEGYWAQGHDTSRTPQERLVGGAGVNNERPLRRAALAQVAHHDTPEFSRYFDGSKVVNDDGSPKVVYHGTTKDFPAFNTRPGVNAMSAPQNVLGSWFTENPERAGSYAAVAQSGGQVMPVYLSLKNPYTMSREEFSAIGALAGDDAKAQAADGYRARRQELEALGYDGIVMPMPGKGNPLAYVAFNPEQIKSINNRGTYNPRKQEMLESKSRDTVSPFLTEEEREIASEQRIKKIESLLKALPPATETASVAYSGRAKRGWYIRSADAIVDVFGEIDAPRFTALLAATSPQSSVESNLINALNIWVNWDKAGRPTDAKAIVRIMGASVQGGKGEDSILYAWQPNTIKALSAEDPRKVTLSGPKVNSFMLNLRKQVNEVTNDAWMANYGGVDQELFKKKTTKQGGKEIGPGKGPGYMAMSVLVRKAAKILTERTGMAWTPAEVQETVWSWAKTVYERARGGAESAVELISGGKVTHEEIASTPDFELLFQQEVYQKILEKGGYRGSLNRTAQGDGRSGGASGLAGDISSAEGSGIAAAAFAADLKRAARRLDKLRADRDERRGQDQAGPEVSRLPKLPEQSPGPNARIVAAAKKYLASKGLPHRRQAFHVTVDPQRGKRLADAYEAMQHAPDNATVKAAYKAMADEVKAQYQAVIDMGLKVERIAPGSPDPYPSGPKEVLTDLQKNHLWFYPTTSGFGTLTEIKNNPLLEPTEFKVGEHVMLVNDLFRVVHDVFGHGLEGAGFGASGEENAWQAHVRMFTPLAARAMTSETRGQNSTVNFSGTLLYKALGEKKARELYGDEGRLSRENTGDRGGRDVSDGQIVPGLQLLARNDGTVLQSEDRKLGALRGTGDQRSSSNADPSGISRRDGTAANADASDRQDGQQRPLRAGQRPVGDGRSKLSQQAPQHSSNAGGRNPNDVGVGGKAEGFKTGPVDPAEQVRMDRRGNSDSAKGLPLWKTITIGEHNRLHPKDTIYADQKTGLLPEWASTEGIIDDQAEAQARRSKARPRQETLAQTGQPGTAEAGVQGSGKSQARVDRGDGRADLTHWSEEKRDVIDPEKFGSNPYIRGAERERARRPNWINRSYYGVGGSYRKEGMLRDVRHDTSIEAKSLYDFKANPLALPDRDLNQYEAAIKRAGFKGYFVHHELGTVAAVFEALKPERVTVEGKQVTLQQVGSDNFKRWFGDSKVVDDGGKPLVVFHGSPGDGFDTFDKSKPGTTTVMGIPVTVKRHAFYFAENRDFAQGFADQGKYSQGRKPRTGVVIPVYLSIQNPLRMTYDGGVYWKDVNKLVEQGVDRDWLERHAGDPMSTWEQFDDDDGEFFVDAIKKAGFDGVLMDENNPDTDATEKVWLAFEPTQIKSATSNSGAFDPTKQSILAQAKPEATFFSALIRAVQGIKQEKAPASQWMSMIKNLPGVKTEEVAWTQLEEFLASATGTVTKTQILDHLNANQVQVQEVVQGGPGNLAKKERDALVDFLVENNTHKNTADDIADMIKGGSEIDIFFDAGTKAADLAQMYKDAIGRVKPTKFHQYQLHGGENYRELLLTLLAPDGFLLGRRVDRIDDQMEIARAEGRNDDYLRLSRERDKARDDFAKAKASTFKSSHFDTPNILAHIRFNERTVDGKKVLFIEEIQSDWHQAGRKKGYASKRPQGKIVKRDNGAWQIQWDDGTPSRGYVNEAVAIRDMEAMQEMKSREGGVPDAPFKTSWPELAMKRMVRYAAENGFDKIAWTTGAVQVDRYNSALRNSVDTLYWEKTDKGIHLQGWKGNEEVVNTHEKEDALSDAIGKSMADQIISSPKQEGKFEGDSIQISDTGMAAFYDKILVNIANKLGKKFDAKVGRVSIGDPSELRYEGPEPSEDRIRDLKVSYAGTKVGDQLANIYRRYLAHGSVANFGDLVVAWGSHKVAELFGGKLVPGTIEMPSIDITQSMRDSVMQGQPLFKPGPAKRSFDDYWRSASATRRDQIRANVHAMAEQILGHRIRIATPRTIADEFGRPTPNQGEFSPDDRTISVAIDVALSATGTLAHESIHAMRDLGIITTPEWAILKRAAEPLIRDTRAIYEQGYRDRIDITEEQLQDLLYEEAVAELFNYKVAKAEKYGADPLVIRLINKIKQFLEALRNYFNRDGFRTSSGIFDDMLAGKFKTRKEVVGPGRGYYLTSKNHDKPMFTGFN